MRRFLLLSAMIAFVAAPAMGKSPGRIGMKAPLPDELLGNSCIERDLPGKGKGRLALCMSENMLEGATVGVTLAAVERATLDDLKVQMRESFHETGIRRVISEEEITLAYAPDAIAYRGVYSTNLGLRRTWSAYHDGVLIRVVVSILSKKADGDFEEEILTKIFGPERFGVKQRDTKAELVDE